jgi:hypothetical protein
MAQLKIKTSLVELVYVYPYIIGLNVTQLLYLRSMMF